MGRIIILLYGVVTYVMFLGTFLYAIGFVADFYVPKTVNTGEAGPLMPALLINALLLGLFAIQHSIMARPGFKERWTKIIPAAAERTTFVLLTNLLLMLIFWQWRPMAGVAWDLSGGGLGTALWVLHGLGWFVVLISTFAINHFDLFGLRQVYLNFKGQEYTHLDFKKTGLYGMVRHPIMLGFVMAFWTVPTMTYASLFFAVMTTGYILVALQIEEGDLMKAHPDTYGQYRKEVSMLVPLPKGKS